MMAKKGIIREEKTVMINTIDTTYFNEGDFVTVAIYNMEDTEPRLVDKAGLGIIEIVNHKKLHVRLITGIKLIIEADEIQEGIYRIKRQTVTETVEQ